MSNSLYLMMPKEMADGLVDQLAKQPMPDKSTISRFQLALDVGFMMLMRDFHKELIAGGGVVYILSDSSPQGGNDWQLSEQYTVPWASSMIRKHCTQ